MTFSKPWRFALLCAVMLAPAFGKKTEQPSAGVPLAASDASAAAPSEAPVAALQTREKQCQK